MRTSEITFGVEIESMVPSGNVRYGDYQQGGYHRGLPIYTLPDGWTGERDSSITNRGAFHQIEVVSPILAGEEGLVDLVYALDDMTLIGAKVNHSCGGHVTIGIGDDPEVHARIARLFYRYQMTFFGANGRAAMNRWRCGYCQPMRDARPRSPGKMWATNWKPGNILEFRLWSGTLDATAVVARVSMCVALVAAAMAGIDGDPVMIADPVEGMAEFQREILSSFPIVEKVDMSEIFSYLTKQARAGKKALSV